MHTVSPVPQPAREAPPLDLTGTRGGHREVLSLCPRGRAGSAEFASAQTYLKSERTCCRNSVSALLQPVPWAVCTLMLSHAHRGQGKVGASPPLQNAYSALWNLLCHVACNIDF